MSVVDLAFGTIGMVQVLCAIRAQQQGRNADVWIHFLTIVALIFLSMAVSP